MYIEELMDEAINYRKKIKSNIADIDVSRDDDDDNTSIGAVEYI
jgi:hypothetical protein